MIHEINPSWIEKALPVKIDPKNLDLNTEVILFGSCPD